MLILSLDVAGSADSARLRFGARSSQTDLTTTNGDVSIATVADGNVTVDGDAVPDSMSHQSWRRILMLIIAITVHNIPGGHLYLVVP